MSTIEKSVTYQKEPLAACFEEARGLLGRHYDEVAEFKHILTLDPDMSRYEDSEKRGAYHILTAREGGILIGYISYFVYQHLHYKSVTVASDDIHFLVPEKRSGMVGVRLLKEGEKMLKSLGVRLILLRCKAKHDHSSIFERIGYHPFDIMYAKELGESP